MISIRNLIILMCMVLLSASLFAGGFALTGVGSRATAMGGAFRAVSDDASAMFWNPAGLGFMNENSVHLGGTFILPSATWDPTGTTLTGIPGYAAKEYESEKSLRMFPTAFATKTKESRLKYGLGIYVPYGLGTTWDAYQLPTSQFTYESGFPENEMMSSVGVVDLHPSFAYRILPNLSAGAGLSVMFGAIDIAKIGFSAVLDSTFSVPFPDIAPISTELGGAGIGFGANMGLMYKPTESLSIGLSGKLPSTISMTGEAEVYFWKPLLSAESPAMKVGGKSDIEADLKLPAEIGLGLAYNVMPNWTVSVDYAYTMWSRLDKVTVEMDDPIFLIPGAYSISKSELTFDWEDTSRISLGTEYLLKCTKLRAGFFYDQTPIPESTQLPTLSDISDKMSFNFGFGRPFGPLELDMNAQYVMFSEREVTTAAYDAGNSPTNTLGVYNSNSISGNIGLTYRF
ncbi:MAG: outer membrane protein transport protein [Candidatus Cloacimonetes bacterium]|nr:outer membrane protein transport protein [Candidatus Cloacimonadota bacterium]